MTSELTKKQQGFVNDVIKDGNATKAALNNYDIKSENKENVAGAIGSENLRKPKIKKILKPFIDRLIAHRDKIQKAMDEKDLTQEQYRILSDAMSKANHDIQLLSGKDTERVGFNISKVLDGLE